MTGSSADELLAALEVLKTEHPDLVPLLDFRRDLLMAQRTAAVPSLALDASAIRTRLRAGQPALTLDDLALDEAAFADLLRQVDEVVRRYQPDWPALMPTPSFEILQAWYAGKEVHDPRIAFLITEAMRPFLTQAARVVQRYLNGVEWYRRYCPACGGAPDFATLEQESGARRLYCSRCDTGWRYKRIGCPFCDTENPHKLGYYPSDDGVYRLYVCDECSGYLKTMDLRQTFRPFVLEVERVLTAGMDLAAAEKGYRLHAGIGMLGPGDHGKMRS